MTDDRTLERAARSWLDEGPTRAPDRPVDAALSRIQTTRQERDLRIPRRIPAMFNNRVAFAALVVVIVIIGGGFALTRLSGPGPGGPGPTPTSIASASPAPSFRLTTGDVGKVLQAGTYRVDGFAAPFTVTLPAAWNATEFTPNSIGLALKADGSVNVYMAVMGKVYSDPCHTTAGPKAVGPGVDALVAALSSMSGFDVTAVGAATVGGAQGVGFKITNSIDLATAKCSGDTLPVGTYDKNGGDVDISMFGGESDQFWVLDAGGTRVFIAVTDNAVAATKTVRDTLLFGN